MVLKYTKEPNIVYFSYIIVCVHLNKNISDLWSFVDTRIISDRTIKSKITQLAAGKNVCCLRTFKF